MATKLIVETCEVSKVEKHPNADRLDIATIKGWNCIVGRNSVKSGDLVVYIPVDSIIDKKLNKILFKDSKIQPENGRIKTIKIRGAISQGLAIPVNKLRQHYKFNSDKPGVDVKKILNIKKWEPKKSNPFTTRGSQVKKRNITQKFKKYSSINHLKNFIDTILDDEEIVVTEKIHGTNFRAGYISIGNSYISKSIKYIYNYLIKKNKDYRHFGYKFCYGSHNIELKNIETEKSVYKQITDRYRLYDILKPGYVIYGEIYGAGIQKNYNYGLNNDIDFVAFDLQYKGEWFDFEIAEHHIKKILKLKYVPILFRGLWADCPIDTLVSGQSVFSTKQKIREGVVVKSVREKNCCVGRMIFKYINPAYLLQRGNTEYH